MKTGTIRMMLAAHAFAFIALNRSFDAGSSSPDFFE